GRRRDGGRVRRHGVRHRRGVRRPRHRQRHAPAAGRAQLQDVGGRPAVAAGDVPGGRADDHAWRCRDARPRGRLDGRDDRRLARGALGALDRDHGGRERRPDGCRRGSGAPRRLRSAAGRSRLISPWVYCTRSQLATIGRVTDDVHTRTRSTPDRAPEARVPWPARVPAAVGAGLRSAGRWFAAWVRRLVANPFLWVGLVLGFGTSLLVWESVLLLGVVLWAVGAWVWSRRRTPVL